MARRRRLELAPSADPDGVRSTRGARDDRHKLDARAVEFPEELAGPIPMVCAPPEVLETIVTNWTPEPSSSPRNSQGPPDRGNEPTPTVETRTPRPWKPENSHDTNCPTTPRT
jgi:hypothetical protein